jgi:hypothetical protein
MPFIKSSNKLSFGKKELAICAESCVLFRVVPSKKNFTLMTATASEDTGKYYSFHNQTLLIECSKKIFNFFEMEFIEKKDHANRPYIETNLSYDEKEILHITTHIAKDLGIIDISVLALNEMLDLYSACSDHGDEEIYFQDGMNITSCGKLVER